MNPLQEQGRSSAPAASDRLAPTRNATRPGARQHPRPDAGIVYGGEVSFEPPFTSFDHLVGAGEQRGRNFNAKRAGGGQIDDQLKLARLHTGNSAGLAPLRILPV